MRSQLVTPLHLMILLHHNGILSPYAENDPGHRDSEAVRDYTKDLADWGLIEPWPNNPYANPWRTTDKGKAHVHYLCHIPWP